MMWNISNLPENVNPKMMAWGLVDHNGGRFTIGDTGVSLIVPPQAIPEGHTEGIYIAIMDQEKDHPHITAKESLLSPVVKCGPNGLKFKRPVVLSLPHCALLEDGAWNLKVQYNETESGAPADWKQLIDINKQDGSDPCLALLEPNMVYLMVDHFTSFAVTGNSAASEPAKKIVKIVAYVSPPAQANGDCVVRVYCVGDLPVHLENLHSQETERLKGITREAPQPFYFIDGGGDLLVNLTDNHPGWKNTGVDQKKIRFKHIWEGIESMPSRSFTFSLVDKSVPQFRASFEVIQDCQDGDEQEVSVSTAIEQSSITMDQGSISESSNKASEQTCYCGGSTSLSKAASEPILEDNTAALLHAGSLCSHLHSTSQANILLGGAGPGSPTGSPIQLKNTSSGYFSFGFEPSPSTDSLTYRIRNELILILDPPHPKGDWRSLADGVGFEMKHIRWLANCNSSASPTDILLTALESKKYPLYKLAEKLRNIGRDDAASLVDAQLMLRETEV
ncbi:Netrin receptor unc5c [Porites harrisoni]